MEIVRRQLEADGRLTSGDDIQVALVADLQEIQKQEAEQLLEDIENKVSWACEAYLKKKQKKQ